MKFAYLRSALLAVAVCAFTCGYVRANSFAGKVIEINDGDEVTIFNMNRPVRIRLIGIDAPERNQPFGDIARQHLSDLVYDKVVVAEYSGISGDNSLIGRVLLNDVDISAQMLRDGAAWFDSRATLSDSQRDIYSQSEQAARKEHRGLWQSEGAIAPWEFVKAEASQRKATVVTNSASNESPKSNTPAPELNSMSLRSNGGRAARPLSSLSDVYSAMSESRKQWYTLQPKGENFSVFIPKGGLEDFKPIPFKGQTINVNTYVVRDGFSIYALTWAIGPNDGASDADAVKFGLSAIYKDMNAAFDAARLNTAFECEPANERKVSAAGYVGKEFDLTSCPIRGLAKVFTKEIGSRRQIYLAYVFSNDMEPSVSKFIKSFHVGAEKN
ncbi:MAG TPA: thermonuclease family protein [Pyrinomonadaceae bacterium]